MAAMRVAPGEDYCAEVATYYDRAPVLDLSAPVRAGYDRLKAENLRLYRGILDRGITVRPWRGPGQPYRTSGELRREVERSRTLHLYLTSAGHGPRPPAFRHPLREGAGIAAGGIPLRHNDILRAVHDFYGHVLTGAGFGLAGEFEATFRQMQSYPPAVHPVLFTEQIGQICWFFCGPHLRTAAGVLPRPGAPGYLPPAQRPYPEQKVFPFPARFLDAFMTACQPGGPG